MKNISILKKIQFSLKEFNQDKQLNFPPVKFTSDFHFVYSEKFKYERSSYRKATVFFLLREIEETGWKIQPINRLGFFHRFVYMPEYSKWAQKVCHIYLCKGLYNLTSPLEKGHKAILMKPRDSILFLESPGDRIFVKNYFGLKS